MYELSIYFKKVGKCEIQLKESTLKKIIQTKIKSQANIKYSWRMEKKSNTSSFKEPTKLASLSDQESEGRHESIKVVSPICGLPLLSADHFLCCAEAF
jgi:archaellum component FlaG (FlaF/FlaG flagellin family)